MYRDLAKTKGYRCNEPEREPEEEALSSLQLDTDEEYMDCLSSEDEADGQHSSPPITLMALG